MNSTIHPSDIDPTDEITLTVVFKNNSVTQSFASDLPFSTFQQVIYALTSVPESGQKLFASKSGIVKVDKLPNGFDTPISLVFPTLQSRKRILLMGTPEQELVNLQKAQELYNRKRLLLKSRTKSNIPKSHSLRHNPSNKDKNIHTISSLQNSNTSQTGSNDPDLEKPKTEYTFHKLVPLPFLPNPEKSLQMLQKLRADRGILAIMNRYKWSVPVLTELDPASNTRHSLGNGVDGGGTTRLLGLNRNKGQIIELRLRTDAYDGWLKFNDVRKVLYHELTHNVHGDHGDDFWNLCHKLEREVVELDPFGRKGKTVTGSNDFYDGPRMRAYDNDDDQIEDNDMYDYDDSHRLICDDGGYTGGVYTLGTSASSNNTQETQLRDNTKEKSDTVARKEDVKSILRQAALDREDRRHSNTVSPSTLQTPNKNHVNRHSPTEETNDSNGNADKL